MLKNKYSTNYKKSPTFIDLFCGAGGMSLGCAQAGAVPIAALDCDVDSIDTYKKMFGLCDDVQCVKIEEWQAAPRAKDSLMLDIDSLMIPETSSTNTL